MRARVPASTSNIGPGFDVLGLALGLYVEVSVEEAERLTVTAEGEGSEVARDASHLAVRVASAVRGHDRLAIHIDSEIPLGRGLGSSAALVAATAAAAGADDPLGIAAESDGHAENAAASVLGGLVVASVVDGRPIARRLPLDHELVFVVVIPDQELATKTARALLPESIPFVDAVSNLGRMGLLIAGLGDRRSLVPAAGFDRLHQDARSVLFPVAPKLLGRLREAGAVVACWSGAGPSLLGICTSEEVAGRVVESAQHALVEYSVPGRAIQLRPDVEGLILTRS
ncbi:MAG TPA: homoserine kinase [Acidimicrobiales bacterium]|nr:homoserine kinase [Acidimicrobiales bacterium]